MLRVVGAADPALVAGQPLPDPFSRGLEPAGVKRSLVERVMQRHGPGLLLSVGQNLHLIEDTPIATVFRRSADTHVLVGKWLRLERYHHAAHRTRIAPEGNEGWACRRYSLGSMPTVGENCLIAGLLMGLVQLVGATECRLLIAGAENTQQISPTGSQACLSRMSDAVGKSLMQPGRWPSPPVRCSAIWPRTGGASPLPCAGCECAGPPSC